jgi:ABC-type Mn2+/Zn2+ transport system permease subunit
MLNDLLEVYQWTIPAGVLFSGVLALLGAQLSARDRAMQTVCVSQGAMLGVLLALGMTQTLTHDDPTSHALPLLISFAFAGFAFLVTNFLVERSTASKNSVFAAVFALLLAMGYLVSAVFPALESHMAQIYFGDLATLTEYDSQLTLGVAIAGLAIFGFLWRQITDQSFELAIFGRNAARRKSAKFVALFHFFTLLTLCFSVQFLGFLFTVSCLFLPTTLLVFSGQRRLISHITSCLLVAMLGTLSGFVGSLHFTRIPTVPAVVLCITGFGTLMVIVTGGVRLVRR